MSKKENRKVETIKPEARRVKKLERITISEMRELKTLEEKLPKMLDRQRVLREKYVATAEAQRQDWIDKLKDEAELIKQANEYVAKVNKEIANV